MYSKISTLESGFACQIRQICQICVYGSCIRKEQVADSKISGYVKGLSGSAISGSLRESLDCTILSFFSKYINIHCDITLLVNKILLVIYN